MCVSRKKGSSRMRMARPAARVAPAEPPPRMTPFSLGDMERESALVMACRCECIQWEAVNMPPEEIENHPFQGRKAVVQLNGEQMTRCDAVHFALSFQK